MEAIATQEHTSRAAIAGYLRGLADQLEAGGPVTLDLGGQRMALDPVDPIAFALEGESDPAGDGGEARQRIELELVWWTRPPGARGRTGGEQRWRAQQVQYGRAGHSGQYQSQQYPGGYQQQSHGGHQQTYPGGFQRRYPGGRR